MTTTKIQAEERPKERKSFKSNIFQISKPAVFWTDQFYLYQLCFAWFVVKASSAKAQEKD